MRRWLVVLLLMWLPLQFTWAAAASCCRHNTAAGSHHMAAQDAPAHCDASADDSSRSDDGTPSNAPGMDCGHCHGYCLGMPDVAGAVALHTLADAPPVQIELPRTEHTPAQPERPQWPGLA